MLTPELILSNLSAIRTRIRNACAAASRPESSVRLLLATKTIPPEHIITALNAGATLIGENKVQELRDKAPALAHIPHETHFIGHLQTNKAKDALANATTIQSLDRLDLAIALDRRLQQQSRAIDVLVQVNTSGEPSKYGISPGEFSNFLQQLRPLQTLRIRGLMTIGLNSDNPAAIRPSLALLRQLRDTGISTALRPPDATTLSMGMTHDLELAIAEGSTLIRVGTAIFGPRQSPPTITTNTPQAPPPHHRHLHPPLKFFPIFFNSPPRH